MGTDLTNRLDGLRRFARGSFRTWKPHLAGLLTGGITRNGGLKGAVRRAQALERGGKTAEAAECWQVILASRSAAIGYAGYGGILRRLNRQEEARAVLDKGAALFPHDLNIRFELAVATQALGHLDEALAHALTLVERFPEEPQGYLVAGQVHRLAQRFDDADDILLAGREHCPGNVWLAAEYANVADARADWPEALARWESLRANFPQAEVGPAGLGSALKRVKRYDEAEAVFAAGMESFPEDANIGINRAWLAEERGDWAEALQRWEALWQRFPSDSRIRHGWIECQGKAGIAATDLLAEQGKGPAPLVVASLPVVPDDAVAAPDSPHAHLFQRFESLGENCELGFTQRHFGAEPIGLIRWAGISYEQLMQGLATGFAGVGSVESTELYVSEGTHEYMTMDRNLGLDMHSFIHRDDPNEERIFQKLRRRLTFLRDKLREDLVSAEKIFVFEAQAPRRDDELFALHAATRLHGPVRLLCMRPADADHAPGTVSAVGDGLMFGYLDKLGLNGTHWNISYDLWVEICEKVVALVDAGAPEAEA